MESVDYSNDFVISTVSRCRNIRCSGCRKKLPPKTTVIFELCENKFQNVFCIPCYNDDKLMQLAFHDQRNIMDLEA